MSRPYDIVVIGAGMVGAAFACLAAERGGDLSVALVDGRVPPPFDPEGGYRPRVSAISQASGRVLEAGGAWPGIASTRISPYRHMCVWDGSHAVGQPGTIRFDAADLGERELGHIIENDLIQHALLTRLRARPGVELICPAVARAIDIGDRRAAVDLDDGTRLTARLIVGADGAASASRAMVGIGTRGHAYDQSAVVCHVGTESPHQETAWQRFLPDGPIALLPLADGRSSVVWSTLPEVAEGLLALEEGRFLEELTAASDGVLGDVTSASPRFAFPLRLQRAETYVRDRFALIGDAAHTVHPLAGQGVNLGLLDAAALAEVVIDAADAGRDPGQRGVLRRYERWRKGENLVAAYGIDALGRLFRRPDPVVRALRRAGVALVNRAPVVKNEIVRRAMGVSGDLPKYARPAEAWDLGA